MVNLPNIEVNDYFEEDAVDIEPTHGTTVQSGWELAAKLMNTQERSGGNYPTDYRWSEEAQLVYFPEDEPFMAFNQHWIEREGKKSFLCPASATLPEDQQDDCPLCDIVGDSPRTRVTFNIVPLSDENPTMQILWSGVQFFNRLQAINNDPKQGPLTKHFWALSRQGKGLQTEFFINRVKASDLVEDWGLDPQDITKKVSPLQVYTMKDIQVPTAVELKEVAKSVVS